MSVQPPSPIPGDGSENPEPKRWTSPDGEKKTQTPTPAPPPNENIPVLGGTTNVVEGPEIDGYATTSYTQGGANVGLGIIAGGVLLYGSYVVGAAIAAGTAPAWAPAVIGAGLLAGGISILVGGGSAAEATPHQADPLILDLNGDGIQTTGFDKGTFIDHDNNDFAELSTWVDENDGVLVVDKNNNGIIESGNELFGNNTSLSIGGNAADGFSALAEYDSNNDGVIDATDTNFLLLKILKGDGTLHTLSDLNITTLNLAHAQTDLVDANGNTQVSIGSYVKSDSTTGLMGDYNLLTNNAISNPMTSVTISSEIAELPDMMGYGNVYNLRQAMAIDNSGELQDLVESFIASSNTETQNELIEEILIKWAGVSDSDSTNRGGSMFDKHAAVVAKFAGREFLDNSSSFIATVPAAYLSQEFYTLGERLYANLMLKTQLSDYFLALTWTQDALTEEYSIILDGATELIEDLALSDRNAAIKVASQFSRAISGWQWDLVSNFSDFYQAMVNLGSDFKYALHTSYRNTVNGTSGVDNLGSDGGIGSWEQAVGSFTRDARAYYLDGGAGNDVLKGSYNNDILIGGVGNDALEGYDGNDIYQFGMGDGQDVVQEGNRFIKAEQGGFDTILFGEGITANDIAFAANGNDLVIQIKGTSDTLTVRNQFLEGQIGNQVENFAFSDGTSMVYTNAELLDILEVAGTTNNDALVGSQYGESLTGGSGNDSLYGGDGNDTLTGGTGNDYQDAGEGDDTYVFASGDGQDVINDGDNTGGNDRLKLSGLDQSDVTFTGSGSDLIVKVNGTSDQVTIQNMLNENASNRWIETIEFGDASTLSRAQVLELLQTVGTSGDDVFYGSVLAETMTGGAGNDQLSSYAGDDTLDGSDGNDFLSSDSGNDSLLGGLGNDSLYGEDGNDTLTGGTGNDYQDAGEGDDTYVFASGDGQDVINDGDNTGGNDRLKLSGLDQSDVTFTGSGSDLIVKVNGTSDQVTIQNMLNENASNRWIETIEFGDASTLSRAQVLELLQTVGTSGDDVFYGSVLAETMTGGAGNDQLSSYAGDDTLDGGDGNDFLSSDSGNDSLLGELGNDSLYGEDGNDTLTGGTGNDYQDAGEGDDTYVFASGDGQDVINDGDNTGGNDRLKLSGLDQSDVTFTGSGSDLIVKVNGTSDQVTIQNMLNENASNRWIETIEFGDASTLSRAQVLELLQTVGTSGDDTLYGTTFSETIDGQNGHDHLFAEAGDDTIVGGTGNDYLYGGDGNDTYLFESGDGEDVINDSVGTNVIQLGTGVNSTDLTFTDDNAGGAIISFANSTDTIRIQDAITNDNFSIQLANSTIITASEIETNLQPGSGGSSGGSSSNDYLYGDANDNLLEGGEGSDVLYAAAGNDTLDGGTGDDQLNGEDGNDLLLGGTGNDVLDGGAGNDTLQGGVGNDQLQGGNDNDTYLFNIGDGQDSINDQDGTDTLQFGAGLTSGNAIFSANSGGDLEVTFQGRSEKLTIQDVWDPYYTTNQVESLTFGDSVSYSVSQIEAMLQTVGTNSNDYLYGSGLAESLLGGEGSDVLYAAAGNDTLDGGEGDDQLNGEDGNDLLLGGTGNDVLDGGAGNDTLQGGVGNDQLQGGNDNDTYLFNIGDGQDSINDQDGTDTLQFGAGLTSGNAIFSANSGGDLEVTFQGRSEKLTIQDVWDPYYTTNQVESLTFGDSVSYSVSQIEAMLQTVGTNSNDYLYGSGLAESLLGGAGNDNFYAAAGNDTLDGGEGDDQLNGEDGNDLLLGGTGNDVLDGGAGNDTLQGGVGNDQLQGGNDNDTYLFNIGDGQDSINDQDGTDTLQFGAGLTSGNAIFSANSGGDLEVTFQGRSEKLTIQDVWDPYYTTNQVESLTFGDSVSYSVSQIEAMLQTVGTNSNDYLYGSGLAESLLGGAGNDNFYAAAGNDTLDGGTGDDQLNGEDGNDLLLGGTGNDVLDGGAGNDTLQGGVGNDQLQGGNDNDTYLFNIGDGQDSINDQDGTDTLQFGAGLTSGNAIFSANSGGDLEVTFQGRSEKLTIQDVWDPYYTTNQVESLTFGDSVSYSVSQIEAMLQTVGTNSNDYLYGSGLAESLLGGEGSDVLYAAAGNDTLDGGTGDDQLNGEDGNDLLLGGTGNDILDGGAGNDIYQLGLDSGQDIISDSAGADKILFNSSIDLSSVVFYQTGAGDLQIGYTNSSGDLITIQGQSTSGTAVERFELNNGQYMTDADVNQVLSDMSAYATTNSISLTSLDDVKADANLVAIVNGGWHS